MAPRLGGIVSLVCAHLVLCSGAAEGSQRHLPQSDITPSMTMQTSIGKSLIQSKRRLAVAEGQEPLAPAATEQALAQADACPAQLHIVSGDQVRECSSPAAEHKRFSPELPGKALERPTGSSNKEVTAISTSLQDMPIFTASVASPMNLSESGNRNSTADNMPNSSSTVLWNADGKDGATLAQSHSAATVSPKKLLPTVPVPPHENVAAAATTPTEQDMVVSSQPELDAKVSAVRGSRERWQMLALRQVLAEIEKLEEGKEKQRLLKRARDCADADSVVRCYYARN